MKLADDFHFTQSNLQDYLDCPYRFYLRYILRTKWPALVVEDAAEFELLGQAGARFHRLIQQYLVGLQEEHLYAIAEADPHPNLLSWWQAFLDNVPRWLDGNQFVETTLSMRLAGHSLLAKFDLILVKKGEALQIFDWKTSQKTPRKEWLMQRVQSRLYCLILASSGSALTGGITCDPLQVSMNYWFTAQPETPITLPYSLQAFRDDSEFFTNLIQRITCAKQADFFKTDNLNICHFCVYRSHCDRGIKAGELAAYDDFDMQMQADEPDLAFEEIPEIAF